MIDIKPLDTLTIGTNKERPLFVNLIVNGIIIDSKFMNPIYSTINIGDDCRTNTQKLYLLYSLS